MPHEFDWTLGGHRFFGYQLLVNSYSLLDRINRIHRRQRRKQSFSGHIPILRFLRFLLLTNSLTNLIERWKLGVER